MSDSKQRKILIAMDESHFADSAFEFYLENVHREDDYVILFTCVEYTRLLNLPPDFGSVGLIESVVAEEKKQADTYFKQLTEKLDKYSLHGKVEQVHGCPRSEITRVAEEEKVTLIVTGSRGISQVGRTLLGSVSDYVLHHAHVPVLICKHVQQQQ